MHAPQRLLALSAASVALALALQGCDAPLRYGAATDVHAFFAAVQSGDRAAFDAHVDRAALKTELKRQLEAAVGGEGFEDDGVDDFLGGPAGDRMIDQLISPESFRIMWMRSGMSVNQPPSALELALLLRIRGRDRACLANFNHPDRCILVFRHEGVAWKLVGIDPSAISAEKRREV